MVRDPLSRTVVGVTGFEPATSCSQSRRATKLRYTPLVLLSRYTMPMERARLIFMVPVIVVLMTLADLADGTVSFIAPSHPWWALTGFFAAALCVLFLALETCPPNPITHTNSSFGANVGYVLFGAFFAALTRSAMRTRLDVDTVLEIIPVTVLSTGAFIVAVNMLARLLRPQKDR